MNWKGDLCQALTFVVLPCLGALASWFALRSDRLDRMDGRRWTRLAVALFLLTRVGTHIVVFHLFRYGGGDDLRRVWEPIARAVLEGRDPAPYIDNLYGPLFPIALAAGYALSGGTYPPGIDFAFVAADAFSLVLLLRIARRRFPEATARRLALAFLLCPLLWHGVVVRTQDEPLFAMFLLWTLDLLERGREVRGAVAAAFGTFCTKALFPLWVFPVLLAAGGPPRRTAARVLLAGAITALGMGAYLAAGGAEALRAHAAIDMRGSTSWFLIPGAASRFAPAFRAGLAATALACVAAAWFAVRRGRTAPDRAARGVVAAQSAFFLLCPFTLPPHLVQGLPFLAWQAVDAGAAERPWRSKGPLLFLLLALWQIPSVWLNSEFWKDYPWLIAAWVLTWAWTGLLALRPAESGDS